MKIFKLFTAALVVFAMVSCDKGETSTKNENVVVKVKISTPIIGKTRGEVVTMPDGGTTALGTTYLFAIDMQGDIIGTPVTYVQDGGATDEVMTFETMSNISSLLVVSNAPTEFTPNTYGSRAVLESAVMSMNSAGMKIAAPTSASDHGASAVMLYNTSLPTVDKTEEGTQTDPWTVAVTIAPVMSRIEVAEIRGDATTGTSPDQVTSTIASFELAGVFLNNVYPSMTVGGVGSGTPYADEYMSDRVAGQVWATDSYTSIYTAGTAYTPSNVTNANVWGYNVAPVATAGEVPYVVLYLKNVTFSDGSSTLPEAYVIVKEYILNSSSATLTEFKRGYSYKINTLSFNQTHLQETANPTGKWVKATITVLAWQQEIITPVV